MKKHGKQWLAIFCAGALSVVGGLSVQGQALQEEDAGAVTVIESTTASGDSLEIEFPALKDFSTIDSSLQSADPSVYNFQMFARRNGLYFYFVQYVDDVVSTNANNWTNTHVEMEIWQQDFGYGVTYGMNAGTYIAIFLDDTAYVNNTDQVRGYYVKTFKTELVDSETSETSYKLEYYMWIEFDNNTLNYDAPYAYVKQYQYIPTLTYDETTQTTVQGNLGADAVPNSMVTMRDDRSVVTGDEKSWQVHENIDAKMYT